MSADARLDLEGELDRLYQVPLDDFVRVRNELATRLREDGRSADGLRVHALAKPPLSAWAVNQAYWQTRGEFDALMEAGRALRAAQQASLEGRVADVREAGRARDRALAASLKRALDLLASAGHPPSPAMRVRIATDLEALAAYGGSPPGTIPGRLADDLDAPGFEVFAAIAPPTGEGPPEARRPAGPATRRPAKVVSFEEIASARRAVADAERAVTERRAELHRSQAVLEQAVEAVKAAEVEAAAAKAALERAEQRVEQARSEVPGHEEDMARAKAALADAAAAVERARAALEEVRKKR
jgi:hypothetical protein